MDGAKLLNCKSLNGGRDRTRTCDLLRVLIEDISKRSICSLGFQQPGASAFARPTSSEGSTQTGYDTVLIRPYLFVPAHKP